MRCAAAFGQLYTAGTVEAVEEFGESSAAGASTSVPGTALFRLLPAARPRRVVVRSYRPALGKAWAERVGEAAGTRRGSATRRCCRSAMACVSAGRRRAAAPRPARRSRPRLGGPEVGATRYVAADEARRAAALARGAHGEVRVDRGAGICPTMESAAWEVLGAGLRGETSALVSGVRSWSVEQRAGSRRHGSRPATAGQRFADRLAQQLEGASDGVLCLAAELLYIRDAPLHDMKASTKTDRIGAILAAMSGAPHLPEEQTVGLDDGHAFAGGQGYHARAPEHLQWLCRFVLHWLEQPPDVVDEALRDPFAFREVTTGVPDDSPSIRYVVEYLAWPGIYPVDRERSPPPKDPRRPDLRRWGSRAATRTTRSRATSSPSGPFTNGRRRTSCRGTTRRM